MKNALNIFVFTVLVTLFYWYVGQQVPQKETYPPKTLEIRPDLTTAEMVEIGEQIVAGKGTCLGCHTIGAAKDGLRFPDLGGVGARAATREPGKKDYEYLAEALYEPNAYIVEGFNPGMPVINKPPINLTDQEILTVIAYLQSLGGTPTVTMDTQLKWAGQTPQAAPAAATTATTATASSSAQSADGATLFQTYICFTCHKLDAPDRLVGPSLYDVGSRLSKAQIYEAIIEPDATIAPGYPAGVMSATLQGTRFLEKISPLELKTLVDFLASHKGSK